MEKLIEQVKTTFRALSVLEGQRDKRGLDFGKACYELREEYRTVGGVGNKGEGIVPTLEQLNIPESTAYYWINRYEEFVGEREPRVRLSLNKKFADVVQVEHPTTSREMAYQTDPSAPKITQTELQKLSYRLEGIIAALAQLAAEKKWRKDPEYPKLKRVVRRLIVIGRKI